MILLQAAAALLVAVLVQLASAQTGGTLPRLLDPFLLATVWVAMRTGPVAGQLTGLGSGLLHDGLTGGLFGLTSLANTLVGYFTSLAGTRVVQQEGVRVLLYGLGSLAQQLVLVVVMLLMVPAPELPRGGWILARVATSAAAGALLVGFEGSLQHRWARWRRGRSRRLRFR